MGIGSKFVEEFAKNLAKPSHGFFGFLVRRVFYGNEQLTRKSLELLQIEPHHNVLEVGFGPGYGLKCVLTRNYISGSGVLYGLDHAEAMCSNVKEKNKELINRGKLVILCEDIGKMSIPDCNIDRAFHTHSHIFWPDLEAGCSQLFRVLKPSGRMATVVELDKIVAARKFGNMLKYAINDNMERYVDALEKSGFVNVDVFEVFRSRSKYKRYAVTCLKP